MYEKALASFWNVTEIDFSRDTHFDNVLSNNDKHFVKTVLAFFAASDGIVNENLARNFSDEVQIPEARAFTVISSLTKPFTATYSLMIDRYIVDPQEKHRLLTSIHTIPSVRKKPDWARRWINSTSNPCFAKQLVAFACVEGIMFSVRSCAIFWLKKRGLMSGLSFSNELISRDEGTHQDFAVLLYSMLKNKLTYDEICDIVIEAVQHEGVHHVRAALQSGGHEQRPYGDLRGVHRGQTYASNGVQMHIQFRTRSISWKPLACVAKQTFSRNVSVNTQRRVS